MAANLDARSVTIIQEYIPAYRVRFFELVRDLGSQRGLEIRVAAGAPHGRQGQRGDAARLGNLIPISQWQLRVGRRRITVRRVSRAIRGSSIVVLEQARRNLDAYALLAFPRGRRVAFWGHGRDYVQTPPKLAAALLRALTRRAAWFFAYTEGGAQEAISSGIDPERVTVLYNSVDTTALQRDLDEIDANEAADFRARYQLGADVVVSMGALDQTKRVEFLREAMNRAFRLRPSLQLLICGDGPLRGAVQHWADSNASVKYVGTLTGRQKAAALAVSKLIVNPGRVGLIAVDSLASETPIVTTDWPHHAPEYEYLVAGESAVVSCDDPDQFALAVVDTLQDDPARERLRSGCHASAPLYSVEAMAKRFVAGLEQLIGYSP